MKDAVFTGRDVGDALAAAGRALGLAREQLRYVVLDPGSAGALGMGGTPARIAVLLDGAPAALAARPPRPARRSDPRVGIQRTLRALAEVAGIEVAVEIREEPDVLRVRLAGPGRGFFLEDEGEVLRALEHLLQRIYGREIPARRLALECEGYREGRDAALRAEASRLAAAVRADGLPRATGPLNAYERRVVHLAVGEEPGLRSFSVGEGSERRVTIAPGGGSLPDEGEG